MENGNTDYGAAIRARRNDLGLSQNEVARRACVDRSTVWALESNRKSVRLDVFLSIIKAVGLRIVLAETEVTEDE